MRAVRPFLFWGFASLTTLAAFALRKRPSVGRYFQRQRVSPRAAAPSCERSPHLSQQSRWRGGAAFWVGVRALQRLYNHQTRAEGLVREKSQLGG